MDGDTQYTIGELARRTGLPVRTIRFYSDSGLVPPVDRSPAGYRYYDLDALHRLDLVRTLRDLDVDIATIHRILDREISALAAARSAKSRGTADDGSTWTIRAEFCQGGGHDR
jgi:DNA-binding transcriptional MerR regulator